MPFTRDDITHVGYVSGTTAHEYSVARAGVEVGRVRVPVAGVVNRGEDPQEWVAHRLTELEDEIGPEKLDDGLRGILPIV